MVAHRAASPSPGRVSKAQAAEYFGVSERTIRRWIAEGRIKADRIGPRLIRINLADAERRLRRPIATAGDDAP